MNYPKGFRVCYGGKKTMFDMIGEVIEGVRAVEPGIPPKELAHRIFAEFKQFPEEEVSHALRAHGLPGGMPGRGTGELIMARPRPV